MAIIGFPLMIVGIILIPLPGPGILMTLLGFFILSLEFKWAERRMERPKAELMKLYRNYKSKL